MATAIVIRPIHVITLSHSLPSLAKNSYPHLRAGIILIDVHGQIAEVFDQFLEILRLDLREIDGDALLLHGMIGAVQRLGGDTVAVSGDVRRIDDLN